VWVEDCSIAATFLQLSVEENNLGSVWVQIRKRYNKEKRLSEDVVKEILDIKDDNIKIEAMIAIGYKDEEKEPIKFDDLQFDKIVEV